MHSYNELHHFVQGINIGLLSPTLPDIEILTSSTTSQVSTVLIWSGLGGMLGAVLLGALFDRYAGKGLVLLAGALFLQGAFIALAPFFTNLALFQFFFVVAIFFNFGIMTG